MSVPRSWLRGLVCNANENRSNLARIGHERFAGATG